MQKDLPDTEIQANEFSDKKEEFIEKQNLKMNSQRRVSDGEAMQNEVYISDFDPFEQFDECCVSRQENRKIVINPLKRQV